MRISGGIARGITMQTPRGDRTRPATDGMRQAVFSSLAARVPGARFADLFAGSGGYGLEAFSRGAAGGVFVEKDNRACACIARNIEAVVRSVKHGESGSSALPALRVCAMDAMSWTPAPGESPDLVFVDPPYEIIPEIGLPLFERLARFEGMDGGGGGGKRSRDHFRNAGRSGIESSQLDVCEAAWRQRRAPAFGMFLSKNRGDRVISVKKLCGGEIEHGAV